LEFQVVNYEREISHLKTTYKNLFDSISSNRAHAKLHDLIYENAKLRARLFKNTSESMENTSGTSVTLHVDKPKLSDVTPHSKKLHASTQSHSVPQPRELNVVKHRNVIAPGMFKINPSQTPRVNLVPNKQSSASIMTYLITNSHRHVTVKENMSSNTVTASSTGLVHTARTRRPQPKGSTRNVRIPSASKSSEVKKNVTVEDHRRTLLLFKNQRTMSSECNNIKLAIRNDKSEIVCDTCKQCLVTANHDACLHSSVNALNSQANKDMVILNGEILPSPGFISLKRLHLLHMNLCGPMRVASINGKRYVLVIVDGYSRYTWVHFLRTNDETPEVIKNFLKKTSVRLQTPVIIVRTDNITEFRNHVFKEYFDSVDITHETSTVKTPQQNGVVERKNRTLVETARTMWIFSHALLFLWAEAIATASELELTYDPSTITPQRPSERDLNILFEPLHNEYLGGRPAEAPRAIPAAPVLQNLQALTASMSFQDSAPLPTNSSNTPVSSHNVNAPSQQYAQQQRNLTSS
nr:putative ribonuclease H-like domain-containing protein [Tanacetum cinerariifolium]